MTFPIEAKKLLPHRGKMLLINSVIHASEGAGTATAFLSPESITHSNSGSILSPFFIELVAQTYAAVCGYSYLQQNAPIPNGYLVGVQKFNFHYSDFPSIINDLNISVQTTGEFDGFAVVKGTVSQNNTALAEGKIKVWVPQEQNN